MMEEENKRKEEEKNRKKREKEFYLKVIQTYDYGTHKYTLEISYYKYNTNVHYLSLQQPCHDGKIDDKQFVDEEYVSSMGAFYTKCPCDNYE